MGIVEGLLVRVHGDLVLPVEAMVTQLRHPFIKQLLRFNLQEHTPQSERQPRREQKQRSQGEVNAALLLLLQYTTSF